MFLLGLMFGFLLGLYVRVLCSGLGLGLAQVLGQVGKVGSPVLCVPFIKIYKIK